MGPRLYRMEYGRFFFIMNIGLSKHTIQTQGKASLADILFQKLFSIKKSAQNCSKLRISLKPQDFAQNLRISLKTSGSRSKPTQTAKIHSQTRKSVLQPGIPGSRYLDPGLRTQIPGSRYQDPLEDLKTLSERENSNFRALKTTLCDQF